MADAPDGRNGEAPVERGLHDAAWPDMFSNLQTAYAELTRAQLELQERAKELENTRDLFQQVVEAMSEALFLLDCSGVIAEANPAAANLVARDRDDLVGASFSSLGLPGVPATPWQLTERSDDGRITEIEVELRAGRDSPVLVNASSSLVRDKEGKITGVLVVLHDVTERRRLQRELQHHVDELSEEARRKDEFLAMLAHELRNPLAPILTSVTLLHEQGSADEAARRAHAIIDRQVHHLARLVDDLLEVSRVMRGKIDLDKESIALDRMVADSIEAVRSLVQELDRQVDVSLPSGPVRLQADPVRIEQVLTNLLRNAAEHTEPGGHIDITAARDDGEVTIRVEDDGIGMSRETKERVFDLFFQGDQSLDRSIGGLGIGLTMVKNLVELHGGTVTAHSAGPGRGSEFVVHLPLEEAPRAAREPSGGPEAETESPLRIMVVDDNRDAADSLGEVLRTWGHAVEIAYDGPTALRLAPTQRPDVVLLDIGLPELDGYKVARRLRDEEVLQDTLIAAISGYDAETISVTGATVDDFDAYLVKPVTPEELKELLSREAVRASRST